MNDSSLPTGPDENVSPDTASVPSIADALRLVLSLAPVDEDDEPLGGDPACWAHLFEDDDPSVELSVSSSQSSDERTAPEN
jgi:hypothetical protein